MDRLGHGPWTPIKIGENLPRGRIHHGLLVARVLENRPTTVLHVHPPTTRTTRTTTLTPSASRFRVEFRGDRGDRGDAARAARLKRLDLDDFRCLGGSRRRETETSETAEA